MIQSSSPGWTPSLSPKQRRQYACRKRIQFSTGPRFSGKTYLLEHLVLHHCWHNQARFGIVCQTNRTGVTGIWPALTGKIFDEWNAAGIGSGDVEFGWVKEPHIHPVTKVSRAELRNKFGGTSEILLFPIEHVEEAKKKLFSTEFSGLWLSEVHLYPTDEIFKGARMALRNIVPFADQRLFCDANPPAEGRAHWLYETFYTNRFLQPDEYPDYWDEETKAAVLESRETMEVFEYELDDNIFLDPGVKSEVRNTYRNNRDEYDRFVLGKWIDVKSPDVVFKRAWDKNVHVVGSADAVEESDWEVIAPSNAPNVHHEGGLPLLVGGWDPGEVNHAWVGLQPWYNEAEKTGFDVLDELLVQKYSDDMIATPIELLAEKVLARRKALEDFAGFGLTWADYSDSSAMKARTHATKADWQAMPNEEDIIDAAVIAAVSNYKIRLIGSQAVKRPGWQRLRVNFVSLLLQQRRLRVSANCKSVIRMFENLRKATDPRSKTYLDPVQEDKHLFDALSYPICMLLLDELLTTGKGPAIRRRTSL